MLSVVITALILRATRKVGRGENVVLSLYLRFAHWAGAFFAALEGHLILHYIYPNLYVFLVLIEHYTGLNLEGFRYS